MKFSRILLLIIALTFITPGCASSNARSRGTSTQAIRSGKTWYGVASWYGRKFHGRKTASGEAFNMYAYTAAHKTLPFGTRVGVTNLRNNRYTKVRINDRGPFAAGREIDIAYAAARDIGILETGLEKVRLEILSN